MSKPKDWSKFVATGIKPEVTLVCLASDVSRKTKLAPIKIQIEFYGKGLNADGTEETVRHRKKINTGVPIPPKSWSKTSQEILKSDRFYSTYNPKIKAHKARVEYVVQNFEAAVNSKDYADEVKELAEYFPSMAKTKGGKFLIDYLDDYVRIRTSKPSTAKNTLKKFPSLKSVLMRYEGHKKTKLTFADITLTFSDNFETYLREVPYGKDKDGNDQYYTPTSIDKFFTNLKTFLKHYYKRKTDLGIPLTDAFTDEDFGKIEDVLEAPPLPLSKTELEMLFKNNDTIRASSRLSKIRLRFLLQCSVGCRVSDVPLLGKDMNEFTKTTIVYYPWKTRNQKKGEKNKVEVPYNKYSKYVLEQIDYDVDKLKLSDQQYNDGIKELFKALELKTTLKEHEVSGMRGKKVYNKAELLTSHNGRDTFISQCIDLNTPVPIILQWVGQSDFEVLKKYYKSDKSTELEYMKKWD